MAAVRCYDGATPWTGSNPVTRNARLKAVKNHGGIAVSVYVVGSPGGMRCANKTDVTNARRLGLGVLPNWERAADFFRAATVAQCKAAGVEALNACRALDIPDNAGIGCAFSFDYQVPSSKFDEMTDKLAACGQGMAGGYVPLGYGQVDLIEHWAANGLPGPHWLMGSTWRATDEFTAAEVGSPNVAIVQSHDAAGNWLNSPVAGTDVNTITQPDRLAAWWPDGSPYGGNVPLSDDDIAKLVKAFYTYRVGEKDADGDDWQMQTYLRNAKVNAGAAARVLNASDGVLARVAALQAANTALAQALAQANAELAALKAQGALTLQPGQEIPATVKIGAQQ